MRHDFDRSAGRVEKGSLVARLSPYSHSQLQVEDGYLIALAKQGNAVAYDSIVRRYYGFVRLKASSYFLAGGDADDLIQEGLVGLYKAVRDYRTDRESSFRNFAELCITRQIITAVKTATRNKHSPLNQYVSFSSSRRPAPARASPRSTRCIPGSPRPRPGQPGDQLRRSCERWWRASRPRCPSSSRACSRYISTATPTRRSAGGSAATARPWTTRSSGSSGRSDSIWQSGARRYRRQRSGARLYGGAMAVPWPSIDRPQIISIQTVEIVEPVRGLVTLRL